MRWLPIALGVSLLANVGLLALILISAVDHGHYRSDQASTWQALSAERTQLRAMRTHFCATQSEPTRGEVIAWHATARRGSDTEPYDKDGLLWVGDLAVKLNEAGRAVGACRYMTWQALDRPSGADLDNAGAACPIEPLC